MNKVFNFFRNFNELVAFSHSIFSLPFILIAMLVASDEVNQNWWFGVELLILGILSAIFARNFAMGVNRYLDRDIDAKNKRTITRPNVDGRVSPISMLIFIFVNAILFVITSYFVNLLAFQLSIPILIFLASYSTFKRFSSVVHIILGLTLGLAPIAGTIAVAENVYLWTIYLSAGVTFWVAGFDLLYSLQDIEVDRKLKLHSIPAKFGAKKTLIISSIFHVLTIVFWTLFVFEAKLTESYFMFSALVFSTFMLTYEHYLVRKDFTKIDRAFFTVNGYLGILFLIFTFLYFIF
jgi:4-hydroxybenzoate polyprenyltransferase